VAVRRALGASTLRVVRQHLTESAVLAVTGGVVGLFVAWAVATALQGSPLIGGREFTGFTLDPQVLAFALLVSLSTVFLSGLLPALLAGRARGEQALLRETSTRVTAGRGRLRSAITVVQLGLSLALVVAALLVTRTVRNLHAVDLGFEPERIWTGSLYFQAQG
jgi:putative ABC transport system permease protein